MECGVCGRQEELPFRCRYCKGYFCSEHRLPPNHDCLFLDDFMRQPEKDREFIEYIHGRQGSAGERVASAVRNTVLLRFSKTEVGHLLVGMALVAAVGMSIFGYSFRPEYLAIFVSAFVLHELAHKFLAQFYRAWAEFRLILYGAAITAISALPFFPFKFIAPRRRIYQRVDKRAQERQDIAGGPAHQHCSWRRLYARILCDWL